MQCERAQEYFSDYIERSLDRPMTLALESHLAACPPCRHEIEGLMELFATMEAVPEVEPPADGVWQVMHAIQEERARRFEAARRAPSLMDWLRRLSPASAAMGAGLATLVVGGAWLSTGIKHVRLGWDLDRGGRAAVAPANLTASGPSVQVSMGPISSAGQLVRLRLVPSNDLAAPQVQVTNGSVTANWAVTGVLGQNSAMDFPVNLPVGSTAEALRMSVTSAGRAYGYLVVVPLVSQKNQPVTFSFDHTLDRSLQQLAPFVGVPIVADGALQGSVRLQVAEQSPRQVLEEIARQVGASVRFENGVYRLASTN